MEALEQNNQMMLHRSFKRWKSALKDDKDGTSSCLDYGLFALNNPSDTVVRSTADLDTENARHLEFIRPIARAWRIGIFFAKIRATWSGPLDKSPNRLSVSERNGSQMVSKHWFVEDIGEPPDLPPNAFRDPHHYTQFTSWTGLNGAETEEGIVEMHNLDGSVVLQPDPDPDRVGPGKEY